MIFPSFRTIVIVALAALAVAAILSACGGSPAATTAPAATTRPYDPAVSPYTEEQAEPYLEIANPSDELPCGIFDVNGHGEKIVTVSDYPACEADDYTVYCLTGEATWTDEFVSELTVDATGSTVRFTSAQEGICALFPAD
jgi:ABC-type oligopeptide transport system substrate-binding subunit